MYGIYIREVCLVLIYLLLRGRGELMIVNRCTRGTPADGSRVYVVDPGSQVQKDLEDCVHSEQTIGILHLG